MQARTAPQMCVSGIVHDPWMPESPSRIHRRTSRHVSNSDSVGVCSCGSAGIMQPCSSAIWSSRGIAEPRAPAEPPDCSALNVLGSFIAFLSARRRLSRRSLSLVVRAHSPRPVVRLAFGSQQPLPSPELHASFSVSRAPDRRGVQLVCGPRLYAFRRAS